MKEEGSNKPTDMKRKYVSKGKYSPNVVALKVVCRNGRLSNHCCCKQNQRPVERGAKTKRGVKLVLTRIDNK